MHRNSGFAWFVWLVALAGSGCTSEAWRAPPCDGRFEPINAPILDSNVGSGEHPHEPKP